MTNIPIKNIFKFTGQNVITIILSVASIILVGCWLYYFIIISASPTINNRIIAVLPFLNESGNQENDYFVYGVTEHIRSQLSKITGIQVLSQGTLAGYKGVAKSAMEIGKELNANVVLLGSVNRYKDGGEFEGRLLNIADGKQLWTGKYDFDTENLFDIESKFVIEIADALSLTLSNQEQKRITQKPTTNELAYNYYIKGREYYYLYSNDGNEEAILLFKKALELEQSFALAYAGLGDAYCKRTLEFGYSEKNLDSAVVVCNRALSLDPNIAETYKALGLVYYSKGWFIKALEQWTKAIEIDPNYTDAINNFGVVLSQKGDIVEALQWVKKGILLDPTQSRGYLTYGELYAELTLDSSALYWYGKANELDPKNLNYHIDKALLMMYESKYSEADRELTVALAIDSTNPFTLETLGFTNLIQNDLQQAEVCFKQNIIVDTTSEGVSALFFLLKKKGKMKEAITLFTDAERFWQNQIEQGNEGFSFPYNLATLYAVNNNTKEAILWLQKAADAGWLNYRWASIDPLFNGIRKEEQFAKILNSLKKTVSIQREAIINEKEMELQ